MLKNEFTNVAEISNLTNQSTRNVRRVIEKIKDEVAEDLLFKDENNKWIVDNSLLVKFKPQRIKKNNYYALSVDPCHHYSDKEISEIMKWVGEQMEGVSLEMHYVVEKKIKNAQNHLHCFVRCANKKKLLQAIKLGFSKVSYKQSPIFDLENWKSYMTKNNDSIQILKSNYGEYIEL